MKRPRHSSYPMSLEESEELARELDGFGYRETDDPDEADRRRYYKVEKWDTDELHVEALLYASNDLSKARATFAGWRARRPRGRYTPRQNIRVLDRWPPHGASASQSFAQTWSTVDR
jgi:hypothetical protein